eukprot:TRINITY_DN4646_c0_g1_i1.p1 TRINITY_DN4646_c0_g1~~TRINITY_DN4646_c0_g1_i1.p1  ORF type:complete len:762 (+),score=155.67 TRINITY_DN4646_c0_g1_i1:195-2480(+)
MRQVMAGGGPGPAVRPASRARARSPVGPATTSKAAAYGFQSPGLRSSTGGGASGSTSGLGVSRGDSSRHGDALLQGEKMRESLSGGGPSASSRPAAARGSDRSVVGASADASSAPRKNNNRLAVVVRKRPMNQRERAGGQQDVVLCKHATVSVREPKLKVDLTRYVEEHNFLFDQSFDENVSNETLYDACVRPIIDAVFYKAKCTCFAYGQTGSGKTFTMMGPPRRPGDPIVDQTRPPGIFLCAAQDIFRTLKKEEHGHLAIYIAFYEIYCGKLFDLLNNRQILHARENAKSNVVIVGLQEHPVENVQQLMEVLEYGLTSRTTGTTGANADSSRSHAILQISLKDLRSGHDGDGRLVEHGKISFIDLAGSERGADTHDTDRQTRIDGAEINKSLLALKECIRALDNNADHTPFRGSKLTQVLKDSFVGSNCRTVMIANVSPCSSTVEHSLNTLRYAYRVKELRRSPGGPSSAMAGGPGGGPGPGGSVGAPGGQSAEVPTMAANQEMGGQDGESSDDASMNGVVQETPREVQQQMRVAHLSAQVSSQQHPGTSPRERLFEPRGGEVTASMTSEASSQIPRYTGAQQAPPPAVGIGGVSAAPSGPGGYEAVGRQRTDNGGLAMTPVAGQDPVPDSAAEDMTQLPEGAGAGCSQAALDDLARQHDRLIGTILAEEEELITAHRQHIDTMVELIKEEMVHLNNVDRPGSDVDAYVAGLDKILRLKAQYIGDIRERVDSFKEHLQQEDSLSRKFQSLASAASASPQ